MLLRIIDCSADGAHQKKIKVVFERSDTVQDYVISSYNSPITENFRKTLAWYFFDYTLDSTAGVDGPGSGVVEKLIKFGQYIGDELLGENHQLIKLVEDIEEYGYENLDVQVESANPGFFKELWETVILHESKYVLSTVVKSFTRGFVQKDSPGHYPELNYHLKAEPNVQSDLDKVLSVDSNTPNNHSQQDNKLLHILYFVSRPNVQGLNSLESNSINLSLNLMSAGGFVDCNVQKALDVEQLKNKLGNESRPVHVFHYDGPVFFKAGVASFSFAGSNAEMGLVRVDELTKMLVDNDVGALCVDACAYFQDEQSISASEGLAKVAQTVHDNGLGNVIGLGQVANSWVSAKCFETLYLKITTGLSLAQAVVEARKAMQSSVETALVTAKEVSFHPWPLLVHYGKQPVIYFDPSLAEEKSLSPQTIELWHDKLFGFRSVMLPPLLNLVSDGQALSVISDLSNAKSTQSRQIVSITGEPGIGKSQVAHVVSLYFSQRQEIDFGLCFDYEENFYSEQDMLEMIAPVLQVDPNEKEEVTRKLAQVHCCFVLDNVSCIKEDVGDSAWEALKEFLLTLSLNGHKIIVIGKSSSVLHELVASEVEMSPLSLVEQKIIAAQTLRQFELTDVVQNEEWERLLRTFEGQPWLTKKIVPLLLSFGVSELQSHVERHIVNETKKTRVEQFYEWQWISMKPVWRNLLVLCSEIPGLLLEMLMVASGKEGSFLPAKELFAMLGDSEAKFNDGLSIWESSGFLSQLPHGRIIDSRCMGFLQSHRDTTDVDGKDQQKLEYHFSQLVCEGVRLLSQHMIQNPNQRISNNLLFNRRYWVKHFENLWFNSDYKGFVVAKSAFDQLLQQAKLENESKAWSLDLLNRSPVITNDEEVPIEAKLSWLGLALYALSEKDAKNSSCILGGVEVWRGWFDSCVGPISKQQVTLFHQATLFLERYYQSRSNWNECIVIGEKVSAVFTQFEVWQRVVQSLKSLSGYYYELNQKDQALAIENRIINDIPYETSPPGFKVQQMVDVLLSRLVHAETNHAQTLLDQLRGADGADELAGLLDRVQCDIHYQEKDYMSALPYYCKQWLSAIETSQAAQIEHVKSRLLELEEELGEQRFNECFEREVPAGTVKPKDYISALH